MTDTIPAELNVRKAAGQAQLNANQVDQALLTYARILRDYPDDADSYIFMGDCYLAEGDGTTALLFYQEARQRAPGAVEIERRIRLAYIESGQLDGEGQAILPNTPQAVARILTGLVGGVMEVTEADVERAARLLEVIVASPRPGRAVANRLEEIDALLPALLELNIRQARLDGRPDLAEALDALLENIRLQMGGRSGVGQPGHASGMGAASAPRRLPRVLFLGSGGEKVCLRQTIPAGALAGMGCDVTVATRFPPDFEQRFDVVVAHHPHGDPALLSGLAACSAAGIPIILDLEMDFEQLPINHPAYETLGLGAPAGAKAYMAALRLADRVCVPNNVLAARLQASGCTVQVIPDGWDRSNELWDKPSLRRRSLNLGWIGKPGSVDEVLQIRRIILRVMHEFDDLRLVIVGDSQVYQLFESLPEHRRLFLPDVRLEDYPYLLAQMDILMVPLRNTPFNRIYSDRLLMEAGIRRIPWVASPMPAFQDWAEGGLLANAVEAGDRQPEWYTHLRQLVMDADLRQSLGQAGRRKAEEREMKSLASVWFDLVQDILQVVKRV
jgi:glycosyltransferase involved in cell wall biosynthesis